MPNGEESEEQRADDAQRGTQPAGRLPERTDTRPLRAKKVREVEPTCELVEPEKDSEEIVRLDVNEHDAPRCTKSGVVASDLKKSAGGSGESPAWGRQPTGQRWVFYVVAATILLIVASIAALVIFRDEDTESPAVVPSPPMEAAPALDETGRQMMTILKKSDEAKTIFLTYATAGSPAELLPIIDQPEKTAPLLEKNPFQRLAPPGWSPAKAPQTAAWGQAGHAFGILSSKLPGGSPVMAFFRNTGQGLKLDWQATTGYGTATFEELAAGRGDGSVIRGFLEPAVLYTMAVPETKFECYLLASPDQSQFIWCYVPRDSRVQKDVCAAVVTTHRIPASSGDNRVTVSLRIPSTGALPNQWIIDELLAPHWVPPR
ncbi:MAG: hypothetical protein V4733_06680 [Verrucomicrobiota bacterium]